MRVVVGEGSRLGCRLASPADPMVLVFATSLNVGRPRERSQIVPCMSLVLVVCYDCCCHIVQAEDGCRIAVVVGVPPPAIPPILGTIG
jgi:hypothetical protein